MMKIIGSSDVCIKIHKFLMTRISVCPKRMHEERTWLLHMRTSAERKDQVLLISCKRKAGRSEEGKLSLANTKPGKALSMKN